MSLKDAKVNFVVNIATDLFMGRSIQDVTIRDIALSAQIGEATIYRYFGKKQTLVLQAAMRIGQIINTEYFQLDDKKSGYEKLEAFYRSYLDIFENNINFYKFIREFDLFMSGEDTNSLNAYEAAIDLFKIEYMKAYQLGLDDGSVKAQDDIEMFYFTTTHSLLELCKKLSMKEILNQDKTISKNSEIKCLINLILKAIKK